jgi:hypothetical protein
MIHAARFPRAWCSDWRAFFMLSTGTGARGGHVLEAVLTGMSLVLGVIALAFAETFGAALRHE